MFTDIEAVIFDMDGTLIDSMWLWKDIDIKYLAKHGIALPEQLQEEIEGMSFSETAAYFKKRFQLKESIDEIKNEWNQMARIYYETMVTIKEGVYSFLKILEANHIKLGIATSNSRELVDITINRFGIAEHFESVRTSCEVEKGKPHPDIYLQVARDLQISPEKCLVFEDVENGVIAGKRAGMRVCGIYDEFSKDVVDKVVNVSDYYIYSYQELLEKIEDNQYERFFAN
jgi:HAD superfamily hydrolase (TIGR01509 family)